MGIVLSKTGDKKAEMRFHLLFLMKTENGFTPETLMNVTALKW